MLLSLKWLREFVPFDGTAEELGDRLTMLGLELEELRHPFTGARDAVVGKVLTCGRHPDADKLSVCTVDAAQGEVLTIVCGAPNVAAGQTVAVALPGARLHGGITLKKAKIRGVPSMGMICAEDELGLGEDHDGIMVLDDALKPGTPVVDALGLDHEVLDVAITPNRADCLSVLGLAREVAMAFRLPLTMPSFDLREKGPDANTLMRIEIPEPELCPAYRGRVIENVAVGKSPGRVRWRLHAAGVRAISNVVDATNYVMMELGQPMHAFDLDLLEGGMIRVARATDGMKFRTLDNQERALTDQDLLIRDGAKPVGLAGVMGGANSEMHAGSSRVFLESAVFRPGAIRKTARRLALPSEASYRFERGVDQPGSLFAMNRCAELMARWSGGAVLPGVVQAEPLPWRNRSMDFRPGRARKLLGIPVTSDFCRRTIASMGCSVEQAERGAWRVEAPSHRLDLEREVDLIEEVGRVWGLDRIPATLPKVSRSLEEARDRESEYDFALRLRAWARGAGLQEAVNYSFVGQKDLDSLALPAEGRIPVMNPLSEDQDVLRTALAPGLLNNVAHNIAQGASRVRLFEVAHTYLADPDSDTTAREPVRLGMALYGPRYDDVWPQPQEEADYLDLKGLVEHLLAELNLPGAALAVRPGHAWLEPCVELAVDGHDLGVMGRVRPEMAERYHARRPVWLAELDVDLLRALHAEIKPCFRALPVFPPVRRDMTVIAPPELSLARILEQVESLRLPLLESVALVDVYQPEGDGGERHLTLRYTFRHGSRTLKDKEVDKEREKVAKTLQESLPIRV